MERDTSTVKTTGLFTRWWLGSGRERALADEPAGLAKLDFIEDVPELEGATVVRIREFAEDVERAESVRESEILPALESDGLVVLDFAGIRAATQSFIHALLYRVFRDGNHVETALSIAGADRATQEGIRAVTAYARVAGA